MLPLVGIPATVSEYLKPYSEAFCREAGFKHVSRYINGLLMSSNKTLQGIYNQIVWEKEEERTSRRAMHEGIFEAGWKHQQLMEQHRKVVAPAHKGKGKEVIAIDWTFSYHPYSEKIFGAKPGYDYVNRCWSCYQTVMTAAISNSRF
ncbi:MAG: hypothetical protein WA865_22120 [Spirulinaceae cyanobacterium]